MGVNGVNRKQEEVTDKHQEKCKEMVEQAERKIQALREKADEKIADAKKSRDAAEKTLEVVNKNCDATMAEAKLLEQKVKELQCLLDSTRGNHERREVQVRQLADEMVQSRANDTDEIIRDTAVFAQEAQEAAIGTLEELQCNLKGELI